MTNTTRKDVVQDERHEKARVRMSGLSQYWT